MSVLKAELALSSANNETFSRTFTIHDNGVPRDITNLEFKGFVKATRSVTAQPLAEFTVTKLEPYTDGKITLSLTETQMNALKTKCYYDVLQRSADGTIDNLWIAEFNVVAGVSDWEAEWVAE